MLQAYFKMATFPLVYFNTVASPTLAESIEEFFFNPCCEKKTGGPSGGITHESVGPSHTKFLIPNLVHTQFSSTSSITV